MLDKVEKTCESVGCQLKGYFFQAAPDGEKLLCLKLRHNGETHVKKIPLSRLIKEAQKV